MKKWAAGALLLVVATTGCYHAVIETGQPASMQTIHQTFAPSWIYGLVPPNVVKTMGECPNGVAKVETQLSFLNQLVGFITFGIFTPMEIKVTCAESSATGLGEFTPDIILADSATDKDIVDAIALAVKDAMDQKRPVYVQLP
jgi:hypothetical protein